MKRASPAQARGPSGHGGAHGAARASLGPTLLAAAAIAAAGLLAYANSLHGAFVYDDLESIVNNSSLRTLWPPWKAMFATRDTTISGRPLPSYSFALNAALARADRPPGAPLDPFGFHVVNLAIHIASAWILFGVVRRTLRLDRLRPRFGDAATAIAAITAVLWVVHPLNVVSVTYIVQRVESLMGMFYLLTLYLALRAFTASRPAFWTWLAILACACGMGSKEVMATAPLAVLLFDRGLVSGSLRECARRRLLYGGLAATWGIFALLLSMRPRTASVGFNIAALSVLDYAKFQAVAVTTYLRTALFPAPLIFDYGEGPVPGPASYGPAAAAVLLLLAGTAVALVRWRAGGVCLASFFLILAPSSSFLPIVTERISYHRMYLPLASLASLIVAGTYGIGSRLVMRGGDPRAARRRLGAALGIVAAGLAAIGLGRATHGFNEAFRSSRTLWADVLAKMETNERAHNNYASALLRSLEAGVMPPSVPGTGGAADPESVAREIERHLRRAIELKPDYAGAYINLGGVQARLGEFDAAIASFDKALELDPRQTAAAYNAGRLYQNRDDAAHAVAQYEKILRHEPDFLPALGSLAFILATCPDDRIRDGTRALELASRAVRIAPDNPNVLLLEGFALAEQRKFPEAIGATRQAIAATDRLLGAGSDAPARGAGRSAAPVMARLRACLEGYERSQPFRAAPREQAALTLP